MNKKKVKKSSAKVNHIVNLRNFTKDELTAIGDLRNHFKEKTSSGAIKKALVEFIPLYLENYNLQNLLSKTNSSAVHTKKDLISLFSSIDSLKKSISENFPQSQLSALVFKGDKKGGKGK